MINRMIIQVLQFCIQGKKRQLSHSRMDLDKPDESPNSTVYIIKKDDLLSLRKFPDYFVDCGIKHLAKGLSSYKLHEKQKIPFIFGSYKTIGKLMKSLEGLLENAIREGYKNKYLIGIENALFFELWKKAEESELSLQKKTSSLLNDSSTQLIWGLMPHYEEPAGLADKYIGNSAEMQLVRQLIIRASKIDETVLIMGETGTGKELVAQAIHNFGERKEKDYRPLNCGAIPSELLESELFGTEPGAYTGAIKKVGLWESARYGTLFLDEIGELTLSHQAKILRTLNEKKIRRVGGVEEIDVSSTRVLTATNRDLFTMVQKGQFREDLYYRLQQFLIRTPALRNHPEDIDILAQKIWSDTTGRSLSDKFLKELKYYRWPGNVRELYLVLKSIQNLFAETDPRPIHLKAVFLMQGHMYLSSELSSPQGKTFLQLESIGHIGRTKNTLTTIDKILDSLIKDRRDNQHQMDYLHEVIQLQNNELEILCGRPYLFSTEPIFAVVHSFKGKLAYFRSLISKDHKEAMKYLKIEVKPVLNKALKMISEELNTLTEKELTPDQ